MICLLEPELPTDLLQSFSPAPIEMPPADAAQWLPLWSRLSRLQPEFKRISSGSHHWGDWDALMMVGRSNHSQFDRLTGLSSNAEAPDHLACVAFEGHGFHGHHGRPWHAMRGNLHLSTLHRMPLSASSAAGIHALPVVSVCDAVEHLAGTRPRIKWVNDVLFGGLKISGSLIHSSFIENRMDRLVLGIGLNVETAPQLDGDDFVAGAGCLKQLVPGWTTPLMAVLECLMRTLSNRLQQIHRDGPAALIDAYRKDCCVIGRKAGVYPVQAQDAGQHSPIAFGRILDLDSNLALRVEGSPHPIHAGRLIFDD